MRRLIQRLSFALQAIIYHEVCLLTCGAVVAALTLNADNQVGLWTYVALWVLRQSAKINLFLGVPVTNDELMPDAVQFLKTYFARKPVSAFFPLSVTLATAVLVVMVQRIVDELHVDRGQLQLRPRQVTKSSHGVANRPPEPLAPGRHDHGQTSPHPPHPRG